tara:strand:- start:9 stop:281 length:273 start_codon:yes stop_codon:yes gene_type:complete
MAKTLAEGRKPTTRTHYAKIADGRKRTKGTKSDLVLKHLETHGTITSWEAISLYRATRLSGIIWTLKQQGHVIVTYTKGGKDFATYKLVA